MASNEPLAGRNIRTNGRKVNRPPIPVKFLTFEIFWTSAKEVSLKFSLFKSRHLLLVYEMSAMEDEERRNRLKSGFLKTLDKSIDSVRSSMLIECFGEEILSILGNSIEGDLINNLGAAKFNLEVSKLYVCIKMSTLDYLSL